MGQRRHSDRGGQTTQIGPFGRIGTRRRKATEGSELIAVLDSGAVSALSPTTERGRARLRALRELVDDLTMPAAVLAEGVVTGHPGRDYHVLRLLELIDIQPVDEDLGHAAGRLRVRARREGADPPPSGIDAIVVALADQCAADEDAVIITSDPDDITALAINSENVARLRVQAT